MKPGCWLNGSTVLRSFKWPTLEIITVHIQNKKLIYKLSTIFQLPLKHLQNCSHFKTAQKNKTATTSLSLYSRIKVVYLCLDQQSRHIGIVLQGSPSQQRYKHTIITIVYYSVLYIIITYFKINKY